MNNFWIALVGLPLVQGSLALVAATELTQGQWIEPVKKRLISLYPLQLVFVAIFLFLGRDLSFYPWYGQQTAWLSPKFFVGRIIVVLGLAFVSSHLFAVALKRGAANKNIYAIFYLVCFTMTQVLLGMDWVMSLEYPWISTLFPVMFVVESLLAGVAVTAILAGFKVSRQNTIANSRALFDSASLLLGLALFTAAMWYEHHLTIWFANIPEEVSVLLARLNHPLGYWLIVYSGMAGAVLPFIALVARRARTKPWVVISAAGFYLSALAAMRIVYLIR